MAARLTPDQKVGSSNLSGLIFGVANMVQRGGVSCRAIASTPPIPPTPTICLCGRNSSVNQAPIWSAVFQKNKRLDLKLQFDPNSRCESFRLRINLDCNIGICHYCSGDACTLSRLTDMLRELKNMMQTNAFVAVP